MPRIGQERFVTPASADMTDEKDTLKENMRRRLITTINSPLVCNTNNPILVALCSDGKHRSFFYLVVFLICPRYSSPHGTSGCECSSRSMYFTLSWSIRTSGVSCRFANHYNCSPPEMAYAYAFEYILIKFSANPAESG